jgi:hypothetical protein
VAICRCKHRFRVNNHTVNNYSQLAISIASGRLSPFGHPWVLISVVQKHIREGKQKPGGWGDRMVSTRGTAWARRKSVPGCVRG